MWIISVAPMPSIISRPVACFQSWRVASGQRLAADTLFRERGQVENASARIAICR